MQSRLAKYGSSDEERLAEALSAYPPDEAVSWRPGPSGKKVAYYSGTTSTRMANEVFGPLGWTSEVISSTTNCEAKAGRVFAQSGAKVRVTCLTPNKHGGFAFHEDIGNATSEMKAYGEEAVSTAKIKMQDLAQKKAVTDARKKALRQFGLFLGLCLVDADFVQGIQQRRTRSAVFKRDVPTVSARSPVGSEMPGVSPGVEDEDIELLVADDSEDF